MNNFCLFIYLDIKNTPNLIETFSLIYLEKCVEFLGLQKKILIL